jgi:hypothetical protein
LGFDKSNNRIKIMNAVPFFLYVTAMFHRAATLGPALSLTQKDKRNE